MTDDEIEFEMNLEQERRKIAAAKLTEDIRSLLDAWQVTSGHRDEIALAVFQAVWFGHSINRKDKGQRKEH